MGGSSWQEAERPQPGRVDQGNSPNNGDDREGGGSVSGSPSNSENTQVKNISCLLISNYITIG